MPKIVRILNRFNVGGPTYNVAYLTKYISSEYSTILLGGQKNESEASSEYILQELDVAYTIIPEMKRSIGIWNEIKALRKLIRIIKTEKPDIVHTHAAKAGTLGRIAAWYCGLPYIFHTFHGHVFHSYFNPLTTKIFITIEQLLAKTCTAIVAISDIQKHEIGTVFKICPPHKIEVIPLGFDLERFTKDIQTKRLQFRQQYNLEHNEIAIGIVGRLVPVKNHELFIQAFQKCLHISTKPIKAFIIGDGEMRHELESLWNTLEPGENNSKLTFTSWIQDVDVAYTGLDIVCLTSHNEGTPVSLIEAQAAGKPIVSTNVGGIQNIVIEGKTALLTNNTVEDFSNKLLQIIENEELQKQMSNHSQLFSIEKFGYKRLCKDMEHMYEKYIT